MSTVRKLRESAIWAFRVQRSGGNRRRDVRAIGIRASLATFVESLTDVRAGLASGTWAVAVVHAVGDWAEEPSREAVGANVASY